MNYLTQASWVEALEKHQKKTKDLEEKYNTKILENGVGVLAFQNLKLKN